MSNPVQRHASGKLARSKHAAGAAVHPCPRGASIRVHGPGTYRRGATKWASWMRTSEPATSAAATTALRIATASESPGGSRAAGACPAHAPRLHAGDPLHLTLTHSHNGGLQVPEPGPARRAGRRRIHRVPPWPQASAPHTRCIAMPAWPEWHKLGHVSSRAIDQTNFFFVPTN